MPAITSRPVTLQRYVLVSGLVTGLVAISALLARRTESTVQISVYVTALSLLATIAVMFILYRSIERKMRTERSLGRVRQYGERLSIYDKGSGFYANWYFGLRLCEEIARSNRYGQPFTLLLVEDLARGLGESMRKVVFRCMDETLRSTDIVAHLNESRFVVLLTNTDLRGALVAIRRIRESLQAGEVRVGVACYPEDGPSVQSLLTTAGASTDLLSAVLRGAESVRVETPKADAPQVNSTLPEHEQRKHVGIIGPQDNDTPENVVQLYRSQRSCTMPGCGSRHHARDLCSRHYAEARRRAA